jgi:hypothetical protein
LDARRHGSGLSLDGKQIRTRPQIGENKGCSFEASTLDDEIELNYPCRAWHNARAILHEFGKASAVIFSGKNPLPFIIPASDVIQRPLIFHSPWPPCLIICQSIQTWPNSPFPRVSNSSVTFLPKPQTGNSAKSCYGKSLIAPLRSIVAQTAPPERWVVVDDGSTDDTANIVESYARQCPWMDLFRLASHQDRSFSRKVHAFNAGLEHVRSVGFDVIGNLDADLSFVPDYVEFLMSKFTEESTLGVAGTPFIESDYDSASHSFEGEHHVAGGC